MYHLLRLTAFLLSKAPLPALDAAARLLAVLVWDVARYRRRLALDNLRTVLGPDRPAAELSSIGRRSVASMILSGFEVFRHALAGDLADTTTVIDGDIPRGFLRSGRGCYMLSCHNGNIDALGAALVKRIGPGYAPAKVVGTPGINRFVMETRGRYGLSTDSRRKKGEGSARIREALATGHIVGFYLDQSRPGMPRFPYFGRPAKTSPSLAALWRKEPAPVIPAMTWRVAPDRHVVQFFPPITPRLTDDEAADLDHNTRLFLKATEALVTRHPEQYLWMHDRWK